MATTETTPKVQPVSQRSNTMYDGADYGDTGGILNEYPLLRTLGLMGLGGLAGNVGGRIARKLGFNSRPGWLTAGGALLPLGIQGVMGTGSVGNFARYGLPGAFSSAKGLQELPNSKRYIRSRLLRDPTGDLSKLTDEQLLYGDLGDVPLFDDRTPHFQTLAERAADDRIQALYDRLNNVPRGN